jgi:hypothetical protein
MSRRRRAPKVVGRRARGSAAAVAANWQQAWDAGDEAVGGSTSTPDQDVVDELGEALGVAQAPDAEVQSSADILADRDRHCWALEREVVCEARRAEDDEEDD